MDNISLIPKDYKKEGIFKSTSSKIELILVISIILALVLFGGLFFYQKSLSSELEGLQAEAAELEGQRDKEFENKAVPFEKTLKNLKVVLDKHLYWSKLLSEIESLAVPQVSFSNFNGILESDGLVKLILDGNAMGYTYLAKQLTSFGQEKSVLNIETDNIRLGSEKGIDFEFIIKFAKDTLLK